MSILVCVCVGKADVGFVGQISRITPWRAEHSLIQAHKDRTEYRTQNTEYRIQSIEYRLHII